MSASVSLPDIPAEVRDLIAEHERQPEDTCLFFGSDTVRLTSRNGLTSLRLVKWEGAGDIAWKLMQRAAGLSA